LIFVSASFQPTSKLYRVDRYTTPKCIKNTTIDWIIFNKSNMRIVGGINKIVIDGWFEILQDINADVSVDRNNND
jgi:hypothetical protein